MEEKIRIENVTKKFGSYAALDGISLSFEKGKIHGMIGRNGSGKTVLFKCICGFLRVDDGAVLVDGKQIGKEIEAPESIGAIIETPGFLPGYSARQNLQFLAGIRRKIGKKEIDAAIRKVGLDPEAKKHVGKYSLGMRQRLGIAQTIMEEPSLLILDEPMTGLDPNQLEEIRHLIKETGKKKTVLLSTHIMQEVEAICDRVIIINQGKIVADRPIGEICTHADEGMVLRVEFSPGSDTHWLSKSELFTHTSQQAPNCWRLTSPQGKDPREALFFEAAVRRCPIIALHTEVYQLEDIFHRYTQNFPAKPGKD